MPSTFAKSSAWLMLLQVTNIVVPYIVIGTLTRQFSLEEFGYVMFCISIAHFCFVVTDFGFYISGVDRIAREENKVGIFIVFDQILNAKIILTFFTIILFVLLTQFSFLAVENSTILSIIILMSAQAFLPTFYYHGMQRLQVLVLFAVISKIIYAGLIFIFVERLTPNFVVLLLGVTNSFAVIMCFVEIQKSRNDNFIVNLRSGINEIKISYPYFISRIFAATYTSFGGLLVGVINLQSLAIYSTAEYFLKGLQSITSPITQAVFPIMARKKDLRFFSMLLFFGILILSVIALVIYLFRVDVYLLVFGNLKLLDDHILASFLILGLVNFLSSITGYPLFSSIQQTNFANYAIYFGGGIAISGFLILYAFDQLTSLNIVLVMLVSDLCVLIFRVTAFSFLTRLRAGK